MKAFTLKTDSQSLYVQRDCEGGGLILEVDELASGESLTMWLSEAKTQEFLQGVIGLFARSQSITPGVSPPSSVRDIPVGGFLTAEAGEGEG